jgi:hypothetical protein
MFIEPAASRLEALGGEYFNHGGLLRINTSQGWTEMHDGDWLSVLDEDGQTPLDAHGVTDWSDVAHRRVYANGKRCCFGTKGGQCRNEARWKHDSGEALLPQTHRRRRSVEYRDLNV